MYSNVMLDFLFFLVKVRLGEMYSSLDLYIVLSSPLSQVESSPFQSVFRCITLSASRYNVTSYNVTSLRSLVSGCDRCAQKAGY